MIESSSKNVRDGVPVKEALAMINKATGFYVWVKVCPEDGMYLAISKAQARRFVKQAADLWQDNILARLDDDLAFCLN